jgi:hypothetical protein
MKNINNLYSALVGFMYFDTLLYAILAWYIENVFPGEFGIARPPWFFVTKQYWSDILGLKDTPRENLLSEIDTYHDDVEPVSSEVQDRASVFIRNLYKTFSKGFGRGSMTAVDGLNLTIYDDQITAFLGHNGAGKPLSLSPSPSILYPLSSILSPLSSLLQFVFNSFFIRF